MEKFIAIDLGGTFIKFAIVTSEGDLEKTWKIPTNTHEKGVHIVDDLIMSIHSNVEFNKESYKGIGVGVPGPVSKNGAVVIRAVNLGWENVELGSLLETEFQIPVSLINDANAAALGEFWSNHYAKNSNLLFITLGTGLGGGVIVNGRILVGDNSAGGEIGHIPVVSSENRMCGCGNINCLETFVSANGLVKTMQQHSAKLGGSYATADAEEVFRLAYDDEDSLAQQTLDETFELLAQHLAGIVNTIDCNHIMVGGGLSESGDRLILPLRDKMEKYIFPQIRGNYTVEKSQLGNTAGLLGSVYSFVV